MPEPNPLDRWRAKPSEPPPQTPPVEAPPPRTPVTTAAPTAPAEDLDTPRYPRWWNPQNTLEMQFRRRAGLPSEGLPAHDPSNLSVSQAAQSTMLGLLQGIDWVIANGPQQAEAGERDIKKGDPYKGLLKITRGAGVTGMATGAPGLVKAFALAPVATTAIGATAAGAATWTMDKVREVAKSLGATDDQADLAAELSAAAAGAGAAKVTSLGTNAAATWNRGRLTNKSFLELIKGVPRTGERMYEQPDLDTAMPHINAHSREPITTVRQGMDAAQKAIGGIAEKVRGYILASPNDQVAGNAWTRMVNRLDQSQQDDFTRRGLKWIQQKYGSRLSQGSISLKDADEIREELNAWNRKAMNETKTNKADLQKTDPAFAARENLAESLRNDIYDHLEHTRRIAGVRDLRRAEGSIMKIRDAFEGALPRAENKVGGTAPFSELRELAEAGARFTGVNAVTGGAASRVLRSPANRTVNEQTARAFRIRPYDTPATYPAVPPPFVAPPPGPPGPPLGRTQTAWGPPPPGTPGAPVASHPTPPPPAPPPTPAPPPGPPGPMWGGPGAVPTGAGRTPAAQAAADAAAARPAPGPADPMRQALEALAVEAQAQGVQFTHDRGQAAVQAIATGRMSAAQAARAFGQQRLPPSSVITPAAPPGSVEPTPSGGGGVAPQPLAVEMGPDGRFRPTQLSSDPAQTGAPTVTAAPLATGQRQIGPARTIFGTANPTTLNPEDMYQPPTGPYPPRPPVEEPTPPVPTSTLVREPGTLTEADLTPKEQALFHDIQNGPKPMPREELLRLIALDRAETAAAASPTTVGEAVEPATPSRGKKKASAPVSDEGVIVGHEIDPHAPVKEGGYRAIRSTEPGATPAPLLTDARRAMLERMVADFENFPPTPGTLVKGSEQWRYGYDREQYVRGAAGTHVSDDIRVFSGRHGSNGEMRQAIEQLLSGATPSNKLHTAALAAADGYLAGELRPPLTPGNRVTTVADVLGTGEVQPRLPEAGAVRDVDVPTPTMEAPFSLSGGVSERPQGKTSDLFAAPVEPAPSPYPADKAKWGPAQWEQFNKLRAAGLMPEQARRRVNKDMKKN